MQTLLIWIVEKYLTYLSCNFQKTESAPYLVIDDPIMLRLLKYVYLASSFKRNMGCPQMMTTVLAQNAPHCEFLLRNGVGKTCPWKNIYFTVWMYTKAGKKEFLKSYIGLWSFLLTSTGRPVHSAGINGAVQLGPQKDNVRFRKFFLPKFSPYS